MKSTEFISIIENYKKKLVFVNIIWAIITISLIVTIIIQKKENDKKELLVIADNGRFKVKQTPEETLYKFDIRNYTKLILNKMLSNDRETFDDNLNDLKGLVEKNAFTEMKKYLTTNNAKKIISDRSIYFKADIDSIKINEEGSNITVTAYLIQNIIKDFELVKFNPIGVTFGLEASDKSELNPYGIMANNLSIFKYTISNYNLLSEEQINTIQQENGN